jgi:hypothetical protein
LLVAGGVCLFVGGLGSLGLLALAGVAGLLATRGPFRRVVGGVLAVAGLVAGAVGWVGVGVLGGALVIAAGVLAVVSSASWPALGARYADPAGRHGAPDPWTALDQGDDPTV